MTATEAQARLSSEHRAAKVICLWGLDHLDQRTVYSKIRKALANFDVRVTKHVREKKVRDGKARGRVHSDDSAGGDGDKQTEPGAPYDTNPSVRYEIDIENVTPNARDDAFDRLEQL